MKGRLNGKERAAMERSVRLYRELTALLEKGIALTVDGYSEEPDMALADMLLQEGTVTYMRSYTFDAKGHVTGVDFGRVEIPDDKDNNK